jgi:hypothetical protein
MHALLLCSSLSGYSNTSTCWHTYSSSVHVLSAQLKALSYFQAASLVQHCMRRCMRRCMRNSAAFALALAKPALMCML